jgi:hypothetical protein
MTADPAFTGERPLLPGLTPHLAKGEVVRWAARPSVFSLLRTKSWLWWAGGIWLSLALALVFYGWISVEEFLFLGLVGIAFLAAPFLIFFEGDRTIYAITNRRALIVHNGMRPSLISVEFSRMDEKLEVLETGGSAGHVYFASNMPAKQRDTDYTGKIAFRDVANVQQVALLLDAARQHQDK